MRMADTSNGDEPATRNGSRAAEQTPADERDEYAPFEALARKLVQVPKAELDAKRNAAKA